MKSASGTSSQLYSVQCTKCYKLRLIPTPEKYEEIREALNEQPFTCEKAGEWRAGISCDNVADITMDDSHVWGIDMPSTARTPPGWKRLVIIRQTRTSKFADVYYFSPTGKKLRSFGEIESYLDEHPEEGASAEQFCFEIPVPWDGSYADED